VWLKAPFSGQRVIAKGPVKRQAGRVIRPWPTINSQSLADYRVFRVRRDRKRSPRTGQMHDFHILECPGWVNVIALTPEQQVILVEQYRHGTDSIELEIPGGVMDPEDSSPVATAVRELREETGYEGENARVISAIAPNPAIMNNTCYTVLIENCHLKHSVQFDHAEDVLTRLAPAAELPALVAAGKIRHSLILAALYRYELLRRRQT
jgi:8-oxo-dGTP pyrophosphatase MutT (NUDIX family)